MKHKLESRLLEEISIISDIQIESHFLGRLIGSLGVPKERDAWNSQGERKDKLESRLLGEISITSDKPMTPPLWQKARKN